MVLYNVGPYFPLLLLVPVRIHICVGQVWVYGSVTIPLTEVLGVSHGLSTFFHSLDWCLHHFAEILHKHQWRIGRLF